jgi:hypothetical protein
MTIQQIVDIPDSHWLTIKVPHEVPAGPVVLTFTPAAVEPERKEGKRAQGFGCLKGKGDFWMADDFDAPPEDFKDYM